MYERNADSTSEVAVTDEASKIAEAKNYFI
jgi:hypothetical protein